STASRRGRRKTRSRSWVWPRCMRIRRSCTKRIFSGGRSTDMARIALLVALAATAAAQTRTIEVDAGKVIGNIRSFQGTNAGPLPLAPQLPNATAQYKEMRIDIVRTHDFFGPTDIDAKWPKPDQIARAVKADGANSIFRDWDADPENEESYNFGP